MTDSADRQSAVDYYRSITGYHQLAEKSHEDLMVGPELLLRHIRTDGVVLDIAGGTGYNAQLLGIRPSEYFCVDLSLHGLTMVREKKRGSAIQADVTRLPIRNDAVHAVLCSWSLEHFVNPQGILEEMIRIVRPGGQIAIWGPSWDNIFRKDFPQFVHKSKWYAKKIRWKIFFKMLRNEFLPFRYNPFVTTDIAAFAEPERYMSLDTDAAHCVLCQETVKFFRQKGLVVVHVSDFSEMLRHVKNDTLIRAVRKILRPFLPVLRKLPLLRWFVMRFPVIVQKAHRMS
jgi:ubiquinone/menaquinone biosynthesis C-methylase UbiE